MLSSVDRLEGVHSASCAAGAAVRGTLPPAVASDGSAGVWDSIQATLFDFAFPASNATRDAAMLVVFTAGAGPGGAGFEAAWGPGVQRGSVCMMCV